MGLPKGGSVVATALILVVWLWALVLGVGMLLAALASALEGNLFAILVVGLVIYAAVILIRDRLSRRRRGDPV